MLRSAKKLNGYKIEATDGRIGNVVDLTVDPRSWRVRHVIADTGNWMPGRRVLLSTEAMDPPDWSTRRFPVHLNKDQVRSAPGLDAEIADITSPERLEALHAHFGWSNFWPAGPSVNPAVYEHQLVESSGGRARGPGPESARAAYTLSEISGYTVYAKDGEIGGVKDLIMDDDNWRIRYLVVGTGRWLPGKKVLISTDWVERCDWTDSRLSVDVERKAVKKCPEFDPSFPVSREVEERLYDFYGRPKYWRRKKTAELS